MAGTGMPNPLFNPYSNNAGGGVEGIDGINQPINQITPDNPPLTDETTAPIEKDNDSVGSGEPEACEARGKCYASVTATGQRLDRILY